MKSMKMKTKTKKSNGKFGRVKFSSKEVAPVKSDLSQLRPPIDTSVSTLYRVNKVLENGSDEVRSILAYECDLIYECRICRSLFRSLANFISHKRIYCKDRFDITFTRISSDDYDTTFISKSSGVESEKTYQNVCGNKRILRSQVPKGEQKKDLTAVVNMLQNKQNGNLQKNGEQLYLEAMHSNSSAVYQTMQPAASTLNRTELMKEQVMELKCISEQTAMLGPSGQFLQSSQELSATVPNHLRNSGEVGSIHENNVICPICRAKFSTKKTLAVHTRTLHTSHRLCYPCPCCSSTFANTWSVYRHLFKVHRKSNEQVRKLRSQIQEKAFIKDTTVAEDLKKEDANKKSINDTLRVNETQEWIDHLESDTELQRCGGCGKRFDRKAALSSHSQYCHRRVKVYENTKLKKITKIPSDNTLSDAAIAGSEVQKNSMAVADSSTSSEIDNSSEICIRVEAVGSLSKAEWDMLETGDLISENNSNGNSSTIVTNEVQESVAKEGASFTNDVSDPLEIVYTNINTSKSNVGSKKRKSKNSTKIFINGTGTIVGDVPVKVRPSSVQEDDIAKLDSVLLMEKKVASIINLQNLQCLSCNRKFTSVNNLKRHAAIHIGWNRYQCKICDYKCFVKCDCVAHCNKIHNAQNNRVIIEEMITQIPDEQYTCNENIMLDITNLEEATDNPKVTNLNISATCTNQEIEIDDKVVSKTESDVVNGNTNQEIEVDDKVVSKTESDVVNENTVLLVEEVVHVNENSQETLNNGNKDQNTTGLDPDLRKMVMEVIFGSSDINSIKQDEVEKTSELNIGDVELQSKESNIQESDISLAMDHTKPQRPIRNKMKPLNKDFIYDLKEVTVRKDSLLMKPFNKTFVKKPITHGDDNLEKDMELPSKRFKSIENDEISILCENGIINKCDKLETDLKNSLSYSQCHS